MQHNYSIRTIFFSFLLVILLFSCRKADLVSNQEAGSPQEMIITNPVAIGESQVVVGAITLTAPITVSVNESFDIIADYACGRASLERAFIIDASNNKIYKNLEPGMEGLQWEPVVRFQDHSSGLNWQGAFTEKGVYLFRTKHNAATSKNIAMNTGDIKSNCTFSGNQVYYFTIEAYNPCATSFTGNVITCGANNTAVYHFISATDETNIVIQGELANFIGTDAVVMVTGAAMKITQSMQSLNSNRTIRLEGNVSACSEVVITISWSSTNYDNTITSAWVVKNAEETELAPSIPGLECDARRSGN